MRNKLIVATQHGLRVFKRVVDYWEEQDHALTGLELTGVDFQGETGLVGTTEGVFLTQDGGKNWVLDSDGIETPHVRWVRVLPQDPRYLYVGTEPANIYSKKVDEKKWRMSEAVTNLRDQNDWFLPYSPNPGCVRGFGFHNNRIYASVEVGGLLKSDDYGDTWSLVAGSSGKPRREPDSGEIHPDVHSVMSHTASKDLVFAPTGGGFFVSDDGGKSWDLKYKAYCRAVWIDPAVATHMVLGPADSVGRGGRIEHSTDGGETWHLLMDNLEEKWPGTMVERFFGTEDELFAVLSNGKILTSRMGEFKWQYLLPGIGKVVMVSLV